jgi:molybdopterin-guanine dinucleotide biosynthesis protein A
MTVTAAVLAGGLGTRIGGDKALVELAGRPLITYPLVAAREAGLDAVVVAKRGTSLPPLDVPILLEPDAPVHPLLGVITALEQLPAVVALPCDMPFLQPADLRALAALPGDLATLWPEQPFPSLYRRAALPQLREAMAANRSMRSTHAHSWPVHRQASSTDSAAQLSINTRNDLKQAEALLRKR